MAFTCGFFNSVNGDRVYTAEQMCNPYHRIVSNGVFAQPNGQPSSDFQVQATTGMNVKVLVGEGIFFDKWSQLDGDMTFTLSTSSPSFPRIDSIVVRIDKSENVRAGSIIVKTGTATSDNPVAPALTNTSEIKEYRLANIYVAKNVGSIVQDNITDTRATSDCGFITHLLQQADITATYLQWQSQFNTWFQNVKETLSTSTLIRSYTSHYTTTTQDETDIPIQITQFNRNLDILQVHINGMMLIKDVDYTNSDNTSITLAKPLAIGQSVAFTVYKSVDGSSAETVVTQVHTLQEIQITDDNGGAEISVASGSSVLTAFVNAGIGFHTMYSASGATDVPRNNAFRYFGHLTGASNGYLFAINTFGSTYINYLFEGTWRGWKVLYENTPTTLYYSSAGVYPASGTIITPSKALSACQHGWELIFEGKDTPKANVQAVRIPKGASYGGARESTETMIFPLAYGYTGDAPQMTVKQFIVSDSTIQSLAVNATGNSRNLVLKAIYEY